MRYLYFMLIIYIIDIISYYNRPYLLYLINYFSNLVSLPANISLFVNL
jgi:hypothetical protein